MCELESGELYIWGKSFYEESILEEPKKIKLNDELVLDVFCGYQQTFTIGNIIY